MKKTNIPAPLHSVAEGNIVTFANEIMDENLNKRQSEINLQVDELEDTAVRVTPQLFTENEQDQARLNINTYSKDQVNNIVSRTPETDVIVVNIPSEIKEEISPYNTLSGKFFYTDGSLREAAFTTIKVFQAIPGKKYWFSGKFNATVNLYYVAWYNSQDQFISLEPYQGSESSATEYNDQEITAPEDAAYLYLNTVPQTDAGSVSTYVPISFDDIPEALSYLYPDVIDPETGKSSRSNKLYRVPGPTNTTFSEWAWDGFLWVMLDNKDYGIDNKPTPGSDNFVKSDGIFNEFQNIAEKNKLDVFQVKDNTYVGPTGSEVSNNQFEVFVYKVTGGHIYAFSGTKTAAVYGSYYVYWFDGNHNPISGSLWMESGDTSVLVDTMIEAPANAAYAYVSAVKSLASYFSFKESTFIKSSDLKARLTDVYEHKLVQDSMLVPASIINNKFIRNDGTLGDDDYFVAKRYAVTGGQTYLIGGYMGTDVNIPFVLWYNSNDQLIGTSYYKEIGYELDLDNASVVAPATAAYCYTNTIKQYADKFYFASSKLSKSSDVEKEIDAIRIVPVEEMAYTNTIDDSMVNKDGEIVSNNFFSIRVYNVNGGEKYAFSGSKTAAIYGLYYIYWFEENHNPISGSLWMKQNDESVIVDEIVRAPSNAAYAYVCVLANTINYYSFKSTKEETLAGLQKEINMLNENNTIMADVLTETRVMENMFINNSGSPVSFNGIDVHIYEIEGGGKYAFSGTKTAGLSSFYYIFWFDENENPISGSIYLQSGDTTVIVDELVDAPNNAAYAYVSEYRPLSGYFALKETKPGTLIDLQKKISEAGAGSVGSKVVILNISSFYIRSRYNDLKDIIISYYENGNGLISPNEAYIGLNTLSDNEIMTSSNLISSHNDSTAPIRSFTQYWHLFAQHGYPIPTIANNVGMTSTDVGAEWKDQLDRRYHIGKVTESTIWLLPVIYQDQNGHYTRDWHSTATSTGITTLTYVSGGGSGHVTQQIDVSAYSQEQLRPIMRASGRTFMIDGKEVNEAGTYYFSELKISESQIGYDPATVSNWFGSDGKPDLTGALPMAEFTWSFNFCGVNCGVNTTMKILREAKGTFSGTQQQFFFDNGSYKAMFMIPKAGIINSVELDKPFNSPNGNSPSFTIYRNATGLRDVDDPVDRQIGFLYNQNDGTYLAGMAAGLSLVNGDTVKAKRNINRPVGSSLLIFSPSNKNKFYVYATDSSVFENGYYPVGYFKEIDYYVSYFDPAENVGQVYWYKDGNRYIIYAHCQSQQSVLPIQVSPIMDGLKLSVVEKTIDAELLSDTVSNGKFFVNYNSNDANYIVLKAE